MEEFFVDDNNIVVFCLFVYKRFLVGNFIFSGDEFKFFLWYLLYILDLGYF